MRTTGERKKEETKTLMLLTSVTGYTPRWFTRPQTGLLFGAPLIVYGK